MHLKFSPLASPTYMPSSSSLLFIFFSIIPTNPVSAAHEHDMNHMGTCNLEEVKAPEKVIVSSLAHHLYGSTANGRTSAAPLPSRQDF